VRKSQAPDQNQDISAHENDYSDGISPYIGRKFASQSHIKLPCKRDK
jgi:hypothetical protein